MDVTPTEPEGAGTIEVTMPETGAALGATVIAWLKRPGEEVASEEPLCLVGWEEQRAEITSPAAGVLRMIALGVGTSVPTGTTLALIDVGVRRRSFTPRPVEVSGADRELAASPA